MTIETMTERYNELALAVQNTTAEIHQLESMLQAKRQQLLMQQGALNEAGYMIEQQKRAESPDVEDNGVSAPV